MTRLPSIKSFFLLFFSLDEVLAEIDREIEDDTKGERERKPILKRKKLVPKKKTWIKEDEVGFLLYRRLYCTTCSYVPKNFFQKIALRFKGY